MTLRRLGRPQEEARAPMERLPEVVSAADAALIREGEEVLAAGP